MWVIEIGDNEWGIDLPDDFTGEVVINVRQGLFTGYHPTQRNLRPVSGPRELREVDEGLGDLARRRRMGGDG